MIVPGPAEDGARHLAMSGHARLVAGMPAEGLVQTGSRTMRTGLLKPVTERPGRMFREC